MIQHRISSVDNSLNWRATYSLVVSQGLHPQTEFAQLTCFKGTVQHFEEYALFAFLSRVQ